MVVVKDVLLVVELVDLSDMMMVVGWVVDSVVS